MFLPRKKGESRYEKKIQIDQQRAVQEFQQLAHEQNPNLAQAQSNRGRKGRKKDFLDAERLVEQMVAQESILSFAPDAEQRLWRTVTRRKYQLTRNRVQLHNRLESHLEEAHIKLPIMVVVFPC